MSEKRSEILPDTYYISLKPQKNISEQYVVAHAAHNYLRVTSNGQTREKKLTKRFQEVQPLSQK